MSNLTEWLQEQKNAAAQTPPFDSIQEKQDYLQAVQELFGNIRRWLNEAETQGLATLQERSTEIEERLLGSYEAPLLSVKLPQGSVSFIPVGRMILGARGRVDLSSPKGMFLLLRPSVGEGWGVRGAVEGSSGLTPFDESVFLELLKKLL